MALLIWMHNMTTTDRNVLSANALCPLIPDRERSPSYHLTGCSGIKDWSRALWGPLEELRNTFTSSWTASWPPQPITWAPAHHILTAAAQRQSFRPIRLKMKRLKKRKKGKKIMLGADQPMTPFSGGFTVFLRKWMWQSITFAHTDSLFVLQWCLLVLWTNNGPVVPQFAKMWLNTDPLGKLEDPKSSNEAVFVKHMVMISGCYWF